MNNVKHSNLYILEKINEYSYFSKGHIQCISQFLSLCNLIIYDKCDFNELYQEYFDIESKIDKILNGKEKCNNIEKYVEEFLSLTLKFIEFLSDILNKTEYLQARSLITNVILEEKYYVERVWGGASASF